VVCFKCNIKTFSLPTSPVCSENFQKTLSEFFKINKVYCIGPWHILGFQASWIFYKVLLFAPAVLHAPPAFHFYFGIYWVFKHHRFYTEFYFLQPSNLTRTPSFNFILSLLRKQVCKIATIISLVIAIYK
jgi:hypothetical protein